MTVDVHETEIDGVRTVWTEVGGPLRAALMVRVGTADETLVTAGISHLVEHLALFGIGRPGDHSNGFVDQTSSVFHCIGDEAGAVDFLGAVTRQLADLPVHRLGAERPILRAEQAGRDTGAEDPLNVWRYGAATYGLASQGEIGLETLDAEALQAWSRRHATTGNAVLWLSGPPPAGLRLHLPPGEPIPAPDPMTSMLESFPAWFAGGSDSVALSAVLARDYANHALAAVLRGRLVDELRTRRAVAYSPQTDYRPLTGSIGRLLVVSDLVAGRQSDGVRPFLAALGRLAEAEALAPDAGPVEGAGGPVTPAEVDEWRAGRARDEAEPYAPLGRLIGSAFQLLHGQPLITVEQAAAHVAAVRPEDVADAARLALATALARVPEGIRVSREPWTAAPMTLVPPVEGADSREHARLGPPSGDRLVVAARGITLRGAGGGGVTVAADRTAALQRWSDGRRVLIGLDANRIIIEPTLWEGGREVVDLIDRHWPPTLTVDMGERPIDEVPRPQPSGPGAPAGPAGASAQAWWARHRAYATVAGLVLFALAAMVFALATDRAQLVLPGFVGLTAAYRIHMRESERRRPKP